jgi:hypothetical protein
MLTRYKVFQEADGRLIVEKTPRAIWADRLGLFALPIAAASFIGQIVVESMNLRTSADRIGQSLVLAVIFLVFATILMIGNLRWNYRWEKVRFEFDRSRNSIRKNATLIGALSDLHQVEIGEIQGKGVKYLWLRFKAGNRQRVDFGYLGTEYIDATARAISGYAQVEIANVGPPRPGW